jgi:hypothetical protein
MPLVPSYLSKACQLNPWPCDFYDGHRNMFGAELTVSHHTSSIKFRLWPCLGPIGDMVKNLWYCSKTENLLWMCTQDFAAWRMSVPRSLVMTHCETTLMCDLLWTSSLKQFLCCLWRDQATSVISIGSKGHTTFMCGLISFDLGSDYSYKFPLHTLCKGEALELFSVRKQLISSQNRDLFPLLLKCRSLFICSPI